MPPLRITNSAAIASGIVAIPGAGRAISAMSTAANSFLPGTKNIAVTINDATTAATNGLSIEQVSAGSTNGVTLGSLAASTMSSLTSGSAAILSAGLAAAGSGGINGMKLPTTTSGMTQSISENLINIPAISTATDATLFAENSGLGQPSRLDLIKLATANSQSLLGSIWS